MRPSLPHTPDPTSQHCTLHHIHYDLQLKLSTTVPVQFYGLKQLIVLRNLTFLCGERKFRKLLSGTRATNISIKNLVYS
jgi:hypothetical protein